MKHYIVKLTSGEHVYGVINIEESDSKTLVLENPLTWEDYESSDGSVGTALVKYMNGTSETNIPFSTAAVISIAKMDATFERYYDAAVKCSQIMDIGFTEKLHYMTSRMITLIMDHDAKVKAEETDGIVGYITDTDTIH